MKVQRGPWLPLSVCSVAALCAPVGCQDFDAGGPYPPRSGRGGTAGESSAGSGGDAGAPAGSAGDSGAVGGHSGASGDAGMGGAVSCPEGFTHDRTECVDVDECATFVHDCAGERACINGIGSFDCVCPRSELGDARRDGTGCIGVNGLVLWLDAADPLDTREPPPAGASLEMWADRSGRGNHAVQPAVYRRPLSVPRDDGRRVVLFDGQVYPNGDELTIDNSDGEFDLTDATIFAVVARRYLSFPTVPGFFGIRTDQDARISLHMGRDGEYWAVWNGVGETTQVAERVFEIGQLYSIEGRWQNGLETQRTNGSFLGVFFHRWNDEHEYLPVHVGVTGRLDEYFNGEIAELLVFDNAITIENRDRVANYLGTKWGITLQR